jgi:hypothetical protein
MERADSKEETWMAQKNSGARRRFARIVSICGLFLLSLIFASLPVAADKHGGGGGGDHGSGGKVEATGQKHDGGNHMQDMDDNDANEHQDMDDNDANDHQGVADNDANKHHDAVDNDANEDHDANDDDAPPVVMPVP